MRTEAMSGFEARRSGTSSASSSVVQVTPTAQSEVATVLAVINSESGQMFALMLQIVVAEAEAVDVVVVAVPDDEELDEDVVRLIGPTDTEMVSPEDVLDVEDRVEEPEVDVEEDEVTEDEPDVVADAEELPVLVDETNPVVDDEEDVPVEEAVVDAFIDVVEALTGPTEAEPEEVEVEVAVPLEAPAAVVVALVVAVDEVAEVDDEEFVALVVSRIFVRKGSAARGIFNSLCWAR